jgi:hypothetical protein
MNIGSRKLIAAAMSAVLGLTLFATSAASPVQGATTDVVRVAGNPKCSDDGLVGLKIDGAAPVGTYQFVQFPGVSVTISGTSADGTRFDWRSTFGLDRVIVKGGDSANVYSYPDAVSDSRLTSPVNRSGGPASISHVEFCTDGVVVPTIARSTDSVEGARGVGIRDIDLTALPANLLNAVAGADLVNDAGTGLRFSGTSLRFSGTSLRFSGTGLRFSGTGLRFSGTSLRFSGTSLRFSGTGLRFSGTGLRFSGDGVGALVELRSAGTGLRFSGTGLRFSGTGLRFSEIPAWDIPLSDLQPPAGYSWEKVFASIDSFEGVLPQNVTFGQLLDALDADFSALTGADLDVIEALASMSLLDLDPNGAILRDVSLVALLLGNTPLTAIPLPGGRQWCSIIDPAVPTCTDAGAGTDADPGIGDTTMLGLNLAGLRSDNLPLDEILLDAITFDPESVIADLLVDDPANATDLYVPAAPGDTLASYLVRGIDALNVPWEQLPLINGFDVREYAFGEPVTFTSSWAQVGSSTTPVSVAAPDGFVLVGDPACDVDVGTCTVTPTDDGDERTDTFEVRTQSTGIQQVALGLTYRPKGLLGELGAPTAGTFMVTVGSVTSPFPIGLTDPWAGQLESPPIDPDVLYFAEAVGGDLDTYDVDVTPYAPGSHVAVRISNLTDDADLVLYRSAGTGLRFSGTGMRFSGTGLRFSGTGLRFSGDTGDQSVESLESETLEDIPIDQGLLVEDVSANRSSTPEAAEGFTSPDTSNFQVQVSGFNQARTEYVLRVAVTEFGDACAAPDPVSTSVAFSGSGSTLVLYPESRFSTAEQSEIETAIDNLRDNWATANGGLTVGTVTTGGADWTTEDGACSVFAANSVAEDVARAVRDLSANQPIEHVMIVGGDDKLPFYRTADTTLIANESNYASTVGGQNPLTAALATQHVLTDDIYGDDDPWPFLNRLYFTPDRAVGRLVESAADIAGQINQFVTSNGLIAVDRAFTAGYDFLSDAAVEIDANLGDVSTNKNSLISDIGTIPDWTIADLTGALGAGDDVKIASINGHMDQGLLLSAAGDAQGGNPDPSEVEGPDVVIPSGIDGAVMFTAGCHAGFSQPYANALRTDDWAQAVAGGPAAVYLANTGYGYGLDQPVVGYSEELLVSFSDLLALDGMTVGQAAMFAKQQYFSSQLEIDPYDEKSQMQLTTYGVPMYSLTAPAAAAALSVEAPTTVVTDETVTDPITGLQVAGIDAANSFGTRSGPKQTSFFSLTGATVNGTSAELGLETSNGNPIQPKFSADVTVPGLIARGVFVESLTSRRENLDNPTIARATVDNSSIENSAEAGEVIFPTAFATVQTEQTPDGPRGKVVVVPGQYDSTNSLEQLLIESLELTTYYAPDSDDTVDIVRPQFGDVSANVAGADVLFRASVSDPNDPDKNVIGTGVRRVLVQYFDGTAWNAVEMFPANTERTEWSGGLAQAAATNGVFFVQAVDGAGNVAVTANKGNNYDTGGDPALAVAFVNGIKGANGWYIDAATVELKGSAVVLGSSHSVTVNGGAPFFYAGPVQLTGEGNNVVTIEGPGAAPITVAVPIDTRAPIVDLDTPIAVLSPDDTVAPAGLLTCTDPTPGSGLRDLAPDDAESRCVLTQDAYSLVLDPGTATEQTIGPFTLSSARGQDIAGNETTESQSAVILSGTQGTGGFYTSPVILGIIGAAAAGAEVSVNDGPFEPYTNPITIDQGSNVVVRIGDDTLSFDVDVDQDDPTAVVTPDPNGQTYDLGQVVPVTCTFADTGSGLASVTCGSQTIENPEVDDNGQVVVTTTLDTSTAGPGKLFVVAATDIAGNEASTTSTYTVRNPFCDPQGDAVRADRSDDIIRCETVVNANRTATISIIVAGQISSSKLQYRLDLATAPTQSGAQVKWSEGKITGRQLVSARINPTNPSRLDFVVDLGRVGVASGGTLYWSAAVQSGEKGQAGAGFLDRAPDAGYFSLPT